MKKQLFKVLGIKNKLLLFLTIKKTPYSLRMKKEFFKVLGMKKKFLLKFRDQIEFYPNNNKILHIHSMYI